MLKTAMKDLKTKKSKIIEILNNGGIGVLPTDTIYGLVGSALKPDTVERIYNVRKRNKNKPMIILIGSIDDLKLFDICVDKSARKILSELWPGKVSVILPAFSDKFAYLHRNSETLAFRLPNNKKLRDIIAGVGPLVAPSANPEGFSPATTIKDVIKYFGDKIDFYIDGGKVESHPSKLIEIQGNKITVLRK